MEEIKEKKCFKCDLVLPITEFYKHKQNKHGYLNECKTCVKTRTKNRETKLRSCNVKWVELENQKRRNRYALLNCEWVMLVGYSRYSISDTGLVKNNETNRLMKQYINNYGYLCLNLVGDDLKQRKPYIHRLLAETFLGKNGDSLTQVDHIDRNPLNNSLDNLRWVTPQENVDNRGVFNKTGVYYDEVENVWCVQKKQCNILKNIGCFEKLETAINELIKNV